MNYRYLLAFAIAFFLCLKFLHTGVRLSDTNIYFETAHQLLQGKILYKDIFFTNFPLFPYVSMLYFLLTFGKLPLFFLTSSLEVSATAILLFVIGKKQWGSEGKGFLSSILYLFSFLILTTSDHQTGVFTASLFAVLSYYFLLKQKPIPSGICIGLALMTKAYFLPVFSAMLITQGFPNGLPLLLGEGQGEVNRSRTNLSFSSRLTRTIVPFLLGSCGTVVLILLPSLIFAPHGLLHDVFAYSLTRSQGLDKATIAWFFIKHDFPLFGILIFSLFHWKKQPFFAILAGASILFFFSYKDIYYLYLNFLVPFLCIFAPYGYDWIIKTTQTQRMIIPTVLTIFFVVNSFIDQKSYASLQLIPDISGIVQTVQKLHPSVIYGKNDIAPALSYLTDTPQLGGVVDTNENIYRKGFLSAKVMTRQAIEQKALIVDEGVYYPEQGIDIPFTSEIFDKSLVITYCTLVARYPVTTEGITNEISLFTCADKL